MRVLKRGQSLVEFALILPILLAVILGLIDGAFVMQGYLAANHAAREAARFAITYQPVQGECLDHNGDGIPSNDPYPWCPTTPDESDNAYYDRRVQMIKLVAREAAIGLRINVFCDTPECISANFSTPGMFGVRVWGFQAFEEPEEEDKPGIPGLPVRVQVIYNVPLVVFAPVLPNPFIRVSGLTEMINEGVQVGYGNVAPPTFRPPPTSVPPTGGPPTNTPPPTPTMGPTPTPTQPPDYQVTLNFETATNLLPDDRRHVVAARVTTPNGQPVAGAQVTFRTDQGSFEYSGAGTQMTTISTGGDGWARTVIYANEPLVAHIEAWLDYNMNGVRDGTEPRDTATKTWEVQGGPNTPYLVLSNHNPEPQMWIAVDMVDHDPTGNPYSLWWCPNAVTSTQVISRLAYPLNVDSNGAANGIAVQVPAGVLGDYRIESHTGDGGSDGCAQSATLVAYSANIRIREVPPDLSIAAINIVTPPEERLTGHDLTVTVEVRNVAPVPVQGGPFDVDLYMNLDDPPVRLQLGDQKQWMAAMEALETTVLTYVIQPENFGTNALWAQVDTTNYIDEGDQGGEDNNVFGPVEFTAECGVFDEERSDNFDGGLKPIWRAVDVGSSVNGRYSINAGGELEIRSTGRTIWSGNNSFYYIYQLYDGDFDARLRVIEEPSTSTWAKVGLMVRESTNANAPYVMNLLTHRRSPAAEQMVYRDSPGGTAYRISGSNNYQRNLPIWVRFVRHGNTYDYYYAYGDDPGINDWVYVNSHTSPRALGLIGIAHASYSSSTGRGIVDDFRICTAEGNNVGSGDIKPPGLVECTELISVKGFEGNPATVYQVWRAGEEAGAFSRTSEQFYRGSFSMRLSASLFAYPCDEPQNNLHPYLYQEVQIPTDIYSHTTLVVNSAYYVSGSRMECSTGVPDPDDELTLQLQRTDGTTIMTPQLVATGGSLTDTWMVIPITLSEGVDLQAYAGQNLRLYWQATHDGDYNGTYFYLDEVSAQVCTVWPIPDDEPGTASFGGQVSVIGEFNIPIPMPGATVLAYAQGGEVYQTRSIHDGTYHFYNIPPGTYFVYAEAWVDQELRTATTTVTVGPDERNYNVNLLLQ